MSQEREEFMTIGMRAWTKMATVVLVSLLVPVWAWSQVLTLTPSLGLGVGYDDNIFQRNVNVKDDIITTITPGVQLRYIPRVETILTFEYQPGLNFFADNTGQNFVSHNLAFEFQSPLSRRFSLTVGDQFLVTREPRDRRRLVDDPGGNPDDRPGSSETRELTIRNLSNATLNVELTPRTSVDLRFDTLYEDVESKNELDEFRYLLGSELIYLTNVARQNRANLRYTGTVFTFSSNCDAQDQAQGICNPRNDDGFTVHAVTVGYEHNLNATLKAEAAIGYATTVSSRDTLDGNGAVVGGIGFVKTLRTGQFDLRYERDFTSGGGNSNQVLADRFIGRLRFQPSPKITTTLSGIFAFLDVQGQNVDPLNDSDRTFFTIRPSVKYQILRFLALNAGYNFALSNYRQDVRADRTDHRFNVSAVFEVRAGLFVDLTYRYRTRNFDNTAVDDRTIDEFSRNEVVLSVLYRPTLRF